MKKKGKLTFVTFLIIWCTIIWIGFSIVLAGTVFLLFQKVEGDLIREEMSEIMRAYARHLEMDAEGNFVLDDFDRIDAGYYCVILARDNTLVFGDCPEAFLSYSFNSKGEQEVVLDHVRYLLEYRVHFVKRYAGISGRYKLCGIARADAETAAMEKARITVTAFILVSLLLLICLLLVMRKRIALPLKKMDKEVRSMSSRMDFSTDMHYESGFQEIDTLAQAYRDVFRKMETVIESQNQFNADVSHELRTPLTVIQAKSQVARDYAEKQQDADYLETLDVIDRQTEKMRQTIDDLISLSRLETGDQPLNRETFDLQEIVKSVCEDAGLLPGEERTFSLDLAQAIVHADVHLIVIAVSNLVSNAIKYSKQGSEIRIRCGKNARGAFCSVSDDGIGISEEAKERVFEHFYRTEESLESEGYGLGLAITRKIMQLHGGDVAVDSKAGKGSTFTLQFTDEQGRA